MTRTEEKGMKGQHRKNDVIIRPEEKLKKLADIQSYPVTGEERDRLIREHKRKKIDPILVILGVGEFIIPALLAIGVVMLEATIIIPWLNQSNILPPDDIISGFGCVALMIFLPFRIWDYYSYRLKRFVREYERQKRNRKRFYCDACGEALEDDWVACPVCGIRYGTVELNEPEV